MKNKKIIGLTLLSAFLISGCTNANDGTTPIKDSSNTTINTESVESESYQYYPLPDGTLAIAVGTNKYLQYLTIPQMHHGKMVTQIADNGFAKCIYLKQINLPNNINVIREEAFFGCSSLDSINIPDSVTSIGKNAFYGCESVTIYCEAERQPEGWDDDWNRINQSIWGRAKWGCWGTYLVLAYRIDIINGERVATILKYRGTESKLMIPGVIEWTKVVGIGSSAFNGCSSLTSIVIPGSVTSIGEYAFSDCTSLTIYCAAEKQPVGWYDDWNPSYCPVVWGYKSKP